MESSSVVASPVHRSRPVHGKRVVAKVSARWERNAIKAQAIYFALLGLWPVLHASSFEVVMGARKDGWATHQNALLLLALSAGLLWSATRKEFGSDRSLRRATLMFSILPALAMLAIDVGYGMTGRLSPAYLIEGGIELVFVLLGLMAWPRKIWP